MGASAPTCIHIISKGLIGAGEGLQVRIGEAQRAEGGGWVCGGDMTKTGPNLVQVLK